MKAEEQKYWSILINLTSVTIILIPVLVFMFVN